VLPKYLEHHFFFGYKMKGNLDAILFEK
jgi:hypothetical protein